MRIRFLPTLLIALACASDRGAHPSGQPDAREPGQQVRDTRTGVVLRVPDGWTIAPPGIVRASLAASFTSGEQPRPVFAVIQGTSISEGRMSGVVAVARPNPGLPAVESPDACAAIVDELRTEDPHAELEGTRAIGGHQFC